MKAQVILFTLVIFATHNAHASEKSRLNPNAPEFESKRTRIYHTVPKEKMLNLHPNVSSLPKNMERHLLAETNRLARHDIVRAVENARCATQGNQPPYQAPASAMPVVFFLYQINRP
jgi:hypothetical protein